jgi:phospholipid/cholesterol/gamma-HCH transport system ATP-binding protein
VIEFKNVTKSFGSKKVLDDISFRVNDGEIVFLIGKSGMGKSVLLKNLVGLIRPDAGEIWIDQQEVSCLREEDFLPVRKKCGMIFQNPALFDSLSVFENIVFGLRAQRVYADEALLKSEIQEKMRLVSLPESILPLFPSELSYGMQKRVSIARTLVMAPKYLLFDEPTTGLDPVATRSINAVIHRLARELRVTSLVVSHDMQSAQDIADRILLLDQGNIAASGTIGELKKSELRLVKDFLAGVGPSGDGPK